MGEAVGSLLEPYVLAESKAFSNCFKRQGKFMPLYLKYFPTPCHDLMHQCQQESGVFFQKTRKNFHKAPPAMYHLHALS